jgi:hypothetical protein
MVDEKYIVYTYYFPLQLLPNFFYTKGAIAVNSRVRNRGACLYFQHLEAEEGRL